MYIPQSTGIHDTGKDIRGSRQTAIAPAVFWWRWWTWKNRRRRTAGFQSDHCQRSRLRAEGCLPHKPSETNRVSHMHPCSPFRYRPGFETTFIFVQKIT